MTAAVSPSDRHHRQDNGRPDIVERLRSLADCDSRAGEPLGKCMREAADEIERLRAELDRHESAPCNVLALDWDDDSNYVIVTGRKIDGVEVETRVARSQRAVAAGGESDG